VLSGRMGGTGGRAHRMPAPRVLLRHPIGSAVGDPVPAGVARVRLALPLALDHPQRTGEPAGTSAPDLLHRALRRGVSAVTPALANATRQGSRVDAVGRVLLRRLVRAGMAAPGAHRSEPGAEWHGGRHAIFANFRIDTPSCSALTRGCPQTI